jgi:D-alanyl-D-alanine dipeptidase
MVKNWSRIGVVIQGSAIDIELASGTQPYSADLYLEVGSQLDELNADAWPIFTSRLS